MWTTNSLAEAAGCDSSNIRLMLLQGKLKGEKLGRDWIIPQEEGERYLELRRRWGRLPEQQAGETDPQ